MCGVFFSRRKKPPFPSICIQGVCVEQVTTYKCLGVTLSSSLSWSSRVAVINSKVRKMLGLLYHRFHSHMDSGKLLELYVCLIRPVLESGAIVSPIWLRMWSCLNVVRSLLYVYA